ncbi:MAG: hypothetical protein FJY98_02715 [Candidatus Liptonbacteria bacterium]|nr:hypothetical protein [Candidatus Liptonbacteria bacterium]
MHFRIDNVGDNMNTVMRRIGYTPIRWTEKGELNCVRPLQGQDYPRFHAYVKEERFTLIFSLHLDQKRPSYGNETAHSGEYEGEIIQEEARRIQKILSF